MNFVDLIIKKRNRQRLEEKEIEFFVNGAAKGTIPDYQIAAMLMAICINGLDNEETACLTSEMTASGKILDLSRIRGIKVDKHSTGGVADTTTLILAPLTASLGLPVIKMCGRSLGHTGGTLDKLESIPGMKTRLTADEAIEQVNSKGIAIMGQTADLAPADKVLYELRDVTGTVESIPLIAASIMSKKLAAGADAIVLDVKCGSGAFMKTPEEALRLAETMLAAGKKAGKKTAALITDMNQPLGSFIGNSLEVIEAAEILKGRNDNDLKTVSLALGSKMLVLGGIAKDGKEGLEMLNENIENGRGLKKFEELISLQGGNPDVLYDYELLGSSLSSLSVKIRQSGFISSIDTYKIGKASVVLGCGRLSKTDTIDYTAGIIMKKRLGDPVNPGDTIAELFAADSEKCREAAEIMRSALTITTAPPKKSPLILYELE
ncbi:MAG: thymidine phosphorylase [Clostridiales bacterium]|nr:thymidine phosphorylase [Clostridiales bacterium]